MIHPEARAFVIYRDGRACRYCWSSSVIDDHVTLDHLVPASRGGSDDPENLVVACPPCNVAKSNATPDEIGWRVLPPLPFAAHEQLIRVHAHKRRWGRKRLTATLDALSHPHPDAVYPAWMPHSASRGSRAPAPMAPVALARRTVRLTGKQRFKYVVHENGTSAYARSEAEDPGHP